MTAQIIILCVLLIELMTCAYYHNKPKEGTYHIGNTIAGITVEVLLFDWAGFFYAMDYPQIIYIFLRLIALLLSSYSHGKEKKGNHNFWKHFLAVGITSALLFWAGIFDCFFIHTP